jgi:hypothetical protein
MNRQDFRLVGAGGAGGKLTDTIVNSDPRFSGFFINSSSTDLNSLDNKDDIDKNYLCISNQNGAGRDRNVGKFYANKHGWSILDKLNSFDEKVIFLVSSLGGGSGSSIVSVILKAVKNLVDEGEFDKTINLIGILPKLDASDDILKNTLDTWNEILSYDVVNNMIFIDNNNVIDGQCLDEDSINEQFATLFDSVFEIPVVNGRNFDTGNLSRVLGAKGCTYIYNLPHGCSDIKQALEIADESSVLAKMYKKDATVIEDGIEKIKCSFIGTSFNDDNYNHDEIVSMYKWNTGEFTGYNEENNLVIVSGCLPPLYPIQVIKAELEDRKREKENVKSTDFSKFVVDFNTQETIERNQVVKHKVETPQREKQPTQSKNIKKSMKKNLFDM